MQGLKPSQVKGLERLYKRRFPSDAPYSLDQARELALLSRSIGRQIGLLVDRKGKVKLVIVGDAASIYIPDLPEKTGGALSGLRLLHTHLSADGLDREDQLDMLFLRLDAVIALCVAETGEPDQWQAAWLMPGSDPYKLSGMRPWHDCKINLEEIIAETEHSLPSITNITGKRDRAILISVSNEPLPLQERNLEELAELAASAGIVAADRLIQRISQPNPKFILGKGKLANLEIAALNANADILIFDGELSPAQVRNLAEITERRVLDRTQLILDIFATRAVTKAGKLQVELAQLAYSLPRLAGTSKAMDRLMGGIGGRGPGESKLETDRRKIRQRIGWLRRELERLRNQRQYARNRRQRNNMPVVALTGYTNAGKSTLLNVLTSSSIPTADKLFATLDPSARRLRFPKEREIILTDTIGFIRNLPDELREAFRATLEELEEADLLIHLADASSPEFETQIASVNIILDELRLNSRSRLLVFNKCEALSEAQLEIFRANYPHAVFISALRGTGLAELLNRMEQMIFMERAASAITPNAPLPQDATP